MAPRLLVSHRISLCSFPCAVGSGPNRMDGLFGPSLLVLKQV